MASVACVVEGDGEVAALPILIRRIAAAVDPGWYVEVPRPFQVKRTRMGNRFGDLERGIEFILRQARPPVALLVLLDLDDDDPVSLHAELSQRVKAYRGDVPSAVVLARREYEAWFLAAAESLRGRRGLPNDLGPPPDPEAVKDAKGWLRDHMPRTRKYSETADQPALTDLFDLDLARTRSASFAHCYREVERLLRALLASPVADVGQTAPAPGGELPPPS
ncbi:MAG TPA: DUF4276 family protein [Gemmataceae bacterium]|nr:DUF4276 family protein [Gemmataceae bacterium]